MKCPSSRLHGRRLRWAGRWSRHAPSLSARSCNQLINGRGHASGVEGRWRGRIARGRLSRTVGLLARHGSAVIGTLGLRLKQQLLLPQSKLHLGAPRTGCAPVLPLRARSGGTVQFVNSASLANWIPEDAAGPLSRRSVRVNRDVCLRFISGPAGSPASYAGH